MIYHCIGNRHPMVYYYCMCSLLISFLSTWQDIQNTPNILLVLVHFSHLENNQKPFCNNSKFFCHLQDWTLKYIKNQQYWCFSNLLLYKVEFLGCYWYRRSLVYPFSYVDVQLWVYIMFVKLFLCSGDGWMLFIPNWFLEIYIVLRFDMLFPSCFHLSLIPFWEKFTMSPTSFFDNQVENLIAIIIKMNIKLTIN